MKVLIVNNMAPFIHGGAEALADHLVRNVRRCGHQAEQIKIPFEWEPPERIPAQMVLARCLELSEADAVVALKFPAYLVRHPRKTLWVVHQFRQAYDLFESGHSSIPDDSNGERIRKVIANADNESFAESRAVFVNSAITQERMKRFNGVDSNVLFPPVNDPELFVGGGGTDYIFVGGRVNGLKRQRLIVEAAALCGSHVKLIVAGPPDTPEDKRELERLVESEELGSRVHLDLRFLERREYAKYVNDSLAVVYAPYDEDSLGYVAMEAATARKPLVTTSDSGGILGLVRDRETGWVAEPSPTSIADALESVYADPGRAVRFGNSGGDLWDGMGVNWDNTVEQLLA